MNVNVEIPEDRAARFQKEAQAHGLTVDRWLLQLAEQNAPALPEEARPRTGQALIDVCAEVRGLLTNEEIDIIFARNRSMSRPIDL
jgi:hypothetical protein